ncbi:hypothetical protein F4820DRAFT_426988 [Hypoxylon rubiginosum]|uniref:Uncharacterized protein n=1 Tax=Hypoxylon rubiginosum TaxID=110542 RepID=A0ACB9YWC0_9PEZI|nr:hypothetical protein F4820DRAFT_426988 [Hypoxylon rubiginosum]
MFNSKVPGPDFTYKAGPVFTFGAADQARYEAWASTLTWEAMALQSQLPEIEPAALLEFVESPQVTLSFMEFARDFWCHVPDANHGFGNTPPRRVINMGELDAAVKLFNASKLERPRFETCPRKDWKPRHHIAHFMRCVYKWAVQDVRGLAARGHLVSGGWQRTALLVGALAVCIRVYEQGQFEACSNVSGTLYDEKASSPFLSPEYLSWRIRHDSGDAAARQRLTFLASQTARSHLEEIPGGLTAGANSARWFTHFAYYARHDFAIAHSDTYLWYSDVGFISLETTSRSLIRKLFLHAAALFIALLVFCLLPTVLFYSFFGLVFFGVFFVLQSVAQFVVVVADHYKRTPQVRIRSLGAGLNEYLGI